MNKRIFLYLQSYSRNSVVHRNELNVPLHTTFSTYYLLFREVLTFLGGFQSHEITKIADFFHSIRKYENQSLIYSYYNFLKLDLLKPYEGNFRRCRATSEYYTHKKITQTISCLWKVLKVRQSQNDFFKPKFPPKNERTNSTLILRSLRLTYFLEEMEDNKKTF